MDLKDKVALVTGGAKGLGKSYCLALLKNDVKVTVVDKDEKSGEALVNELSQAYSGKIRFVASDVSVLNDLRRAFEKTVEAFGKVDLVVNNAGIADEVNWRLMVDIDFIGVIHGIKLAFEYMGKDFGKTGGCIINTGSNSAFIDFPLAPVYAACKHGVVGLTKSYGNDYYFEKSGVTVNALCPGATDTELFHVFPQKSVNQKAAEIHNSQITPLDPDVVAKALIQLLMDQKNGSLLRVHTDGSLEYC